MLQQLFVFVVVPYSTALSRLCAVAAYRLYRVREISVLKSRFLFLSN